MLQCYPEILNKYEEKYINNGRQFRDSLLCHQQLQCIYTGVSDMHTLWITIH